MNRPECIPYFKKVDWKEVTIRAKGIREFNDEEWQKERTLHVRSYIRILLSQYKEAISSR